MAEELSEEAPTTVPVSTFTVQSAAEALHWDRSRLAIKILAHLPAGGSVSLEWLTEVVARNEADLDDSEKSRKRVYVSLYQTHLTKLEKCGAVTCDRGDGVIHVHPELHILANMIESIETRVDPAGDAWGGSSLLTGIVDWTRYLRRRARWLRTHGWR